MCLIVLKLYIITLIENTYIKALLIIVMIFSVKYKTYGNFHKTPSMLLLL